MAMSRVDKNNAAVKALGHPIRREILRRLENNANGGLSPKKVSDDLGVSLGDVSYHFRVLLETTVIKLTDEKRRRGAIEHFYKQASNSTFNKAREMLNLIGKD